MKEKEREATPVGILYLIKWVAYTLVALFCFLFYTNNNTVEGDQFRHRPLWLYPLRFLPDFELKAEWFIYGSEDETTLQGLRAAIHSLNTEASLNKLGKVQAAFLLKEQLQQRACVVEKVGSMQPSRNLSELEPPIVVVGLPRTGTTFMHGMLGVNPAFRVPRFFEYFHSCDPWALSKFTLKEAQGLKMYWLRKLLPAMKSIHFIGADSPEEDIVALGHEMISMMLFTSFHVPKYVDWIRTNGTQRKLLDSLNYLRLFLDVHLRTDDDRPWILKTPWHLAQIEEFHAIFPGTKYVWLHRDPIPTMSSMVDLVMSLIGVNSDLPKSTEKRKLIAQYTIDVWFWALQRGVDARKRLQDKITFIDVSFDALNENPVGIATKVFNEFGYEVNADVTERFREFAKENCRGKRGHHHHKLAFGLDTTALRERYARIMEGLNGTLNYIQP